jgi:biopolymer transport protein ExbD
MSRRFFKSAQNHTIEEPMINLTPLIDVVFVILIMFIVVAPLLELDRVELADSSIDPLDTTLNVQENSPISIHVNKDNVIILNNQKVSLAQLSERLRDAKKRFPKARPQVFHDRRAHFGTYQSIKNAAEAAGFKQMDVILKPA